VIAKVLFEERVSILVHIKLVARWTGLLHAAQESWRFPKRRARTRQKRSRHVPPRRSPLQNARCSVTADSTAEHACYFNGVRRDGVGPLILPEPRVACSG